LSEISESFSPAAYDDFFNSLLEHIRNAKSNAFPIKWNRKRFHLIASRASVEIN